jgi:type IV pilus assembly protein PilC
MAKNALFLWTEIPNKTFQHKTKKIPPLKLIIFYRQLATLINAGVTLVQAFEILLQGEAHPTLHFLIQNLKTAIEGGNSLAAAMQKHPQQLDYLSCHLIRIAELTGTLAKMLARIATNKEKLYALKNKIRQALLYPCIIFCTAIVITATMVIFIIPRFADLFASFNAPLPAMTLAVIHFSEFCRHYSWLLLLPVLLIITMIYCYQSSPQVKRYSDQSILQLPIVGSCLQQAIFARIARTLAIIFASGMPLTEGLTLLQDTTRNQIIKTALHKLQQDIHAGKRIHQAMLNIGVFPTLLIQMIKVGEETGAMELMLDKTAEFYEAQLDNWVNSFSQLLEPLIIIVLGVLIGGLVIALYLPIFNTGQLSNGYY